MPQKHSKSKSKKEQHGAYKAQSRYTKNRKAKLERHLKKHPEDVAAQKALDNVGSDPRREKPKSKVWSSQSRQKAQMLASVGINGMHALGSDKVSAKIGDGEHVRFNQHLKEDSKKDKKSK